MIRMRKSVVALVAMSLVLGGCATAPHSRGVGTTYQPVVDLKDKDHTKYAADLSECQQLAQQRGNTGAAIMAGALAGALFAALVAPRGMRNDVAARTSVIGAATGGGQAVDTQETIIKRCLAGRGYSVLE